MEKNLKDILEKSKGYSLASYEEIVLQVTQKKSVAHYEEKMHAYIEKNHAVESYIQANLKLNKKFFNQVVKSESLHLHFITEAWCLDACIILPLFRAIVAINEHISVNIYLRDSNEELMNQFLTNGSKSIPMVFGTDAEGNEQFRWGPRSMMAKSILEPIKEAEYSIKYKSLSEFYKSDLTMDIQEEWLNLLK